MNCSNSTSPHSANYLIIRCPLAASPLSGTPLTSHQYLQCKSDDKVPVSNYRPIPCSPSIKKILEQVVHQRLLQHLPSKSWITVSACRLWNSLPNHVILYLHILLNQLRCFGHEFTCIICFYITYSIFNPRTFHLFTCVVILGGPPYVISTQLLTGCTLHICKSL